MTAPKSTLRPRRRTGPGRLPPELATDLEQWFEGKVSSAWCLLLAGPDYSDEIAERWAAWKRAHPDARPPAGYEWLDDQRYPRRRIPAGNET